MLAINTDDSAVVIHMPQANAVGARAENPAPPNEERLTMAAIATKALDCLANEFARISSGAITLTGLGIFGYGAYAAGATCALASGGLGLAGAGVTLWVVSTALSARSLSPGESLGSHIVHSAALAAMGCAGCVCLCVRPR
jgi:hypothetical protein